jgi:hypothetical protein
MRGVSKLCCEGTRLRTDPQLQQHAVAACALQRTGAARANRNTHRSHASRWLPAASASAARRLRWSSLILLYRWAMVDVVGVVWRLLGGLS